MVDSVVSNIRRHGEKVFETPPEQVVDNVMKEVRNAGFMVKMFMKTKWRDIKEVLDDPNAIFERVKEKDPEVYGVLVKHKDWVEKFIAKFKEELERYLFG